MGVQNRTGFMSFAAVGLAGLFVAGEALAAASGNEGLEEIIVTAQKRSEDLQKTAAAVTAVSGEALTKAGVTDPQGLTDLVPGVEVGFNNSNTTFSIRGVNSTTDATLGDAAVAFHLDGVFQGRPSAASGLFYDLARVEVLRGPQGTLYGRNATAGVINVIPNHPDFSGLSGEGQVEVGNYGELRTEGMFNAPVSSTLAVRGAAQTLRHNGYLNTGYNDADDAAARLQALWRPTDKVSLLLAGDYFHQGGVGNGLARLPPATNPGGDPWSVPLPLMNDAGYASPPGHTDNASWSVKGELNVDLGAVQLTDIAAYHHLKVDYFSFQNGADNSQLDNEKEISNELRLASADDAKVKWVIGAYYHDEEQPYSQQFYDNVGPTNDTCCQYLGQGASLYFNYPKISNPSYAAFGQVTLPVGAATRLTAGLRWNHDHKEVVGGTYKVWGEEVILPFPPFDIPAGTVQLQIPTNVANTWTHVDWKAGIEHDIGEHSMVYASVSTGYKQGGVFAGAPPFNTYKPETITAYELGSKNRFWDNRAELNVAAFYYDYKDYQIDQLEDLPVGNGTCAYGDDIFNAGKARMFGAELESKWLVSKSDEFDLNLSWLDAQFQNLVFPLPGTPPRGGVCHPIVLTNLSGYEPPSSPKLTATGVYRHTWQMGSGSSLEWSAQVHYESSYLLRVDYGLHTITAPDDYSPLALAQQGAYTRSQTSLSYFDKDQKFSLQLWVRNLENKGVINSFSWSGVGGTPYGEIGAPRTYGVTVGARF